jgi:hypothetical protein
MPRMFHLLILAELLSLYSARTDQGRVIPLQVAAAPAWSGGNRLGAPALMVGFARHA